MSTEDKKSKWVLFWEGFKDGWKEADTSLKVEATNRKAYHRNDDSSEEVEFCPQPYVSPSNNFCPHLEMLYPYGSHPPLDNQ